MPTPPNVRLAGVAMAALALSAFSGPASAEDQTTRVRVSHVDYAVSSTAQARQLLTRLGDAALEACGASSFSLVEHKAAVRRSACWQAGMRDAVRRIDNPLVTAQFERHAPQQAMAGQGDVAGGR